MNKEKINPIIFGTGVEVLDDIDEIKDSLEHHGLRLQVTREKKKVLENLPDENCENKPTFDFLLVNDILAEYEELFPNAYSISSKNDITDLYNLRLEKIFFVGFKVERDKKGEITINECEANEANLFISVEKSVLREALGVKRIQSHLYNSISSYCHHNMKVKEDIINDKLYSYSLYEGDKLLRKDDEVYTSIDIDFMVRSIFKYIKLCRVK